MLQGKLASKKWYIFGCKKLQLIELQEKDNQA